jgi:hypothetical protein
MAMKKLYDLAVGTSKYTNRDGQEKTNWLNVGAIMEKEDGSRLIFLDRTFNPAGVPNPDNRSNVILGMFKPKAKDGTADNAPTQNAPAPRDDNEIPF